MVYVLVRASSERDISSLRAFVHGGRQVLGIVCVSARAFLLISATPNPPHSCLWAVSVAVLGLWLGQSLDQPWVEGDFDLYFRARAGAVAVTVAKAVAVGCACGWACGCGWG